MSGTPVLIRVPLLQSLRLSAGGPHIGGGKRRFNRKCGVVLIRLGRGPCNFDRTCYRDRNFDCTCDDDQHTDRDLDEDRDTKREPLADRDNDRRSARGCGPDDDNDSTRFFDHDLDRGTSYIIYAGTRIIGYSCSCRGDAPFMRAFKYGDRPSACKSRAYHHIIAVPFGAITWKPVSDSAPPISALRSPPAGTPLAGFWGRRSGTTGRGVRHNWPAPGQWRRGCRNGSCLRGRGHRP